MRFRFRVFFVRHSELNIVSSLLDTNILTCVIIPTLLLCARYTLGTTVALKHVWPKHIMQNLSTCRFVSACVSMQTMKRKIPLFDSAFQKVILIDIPWYF